MKIIQKGFNYSQDGPGNRLVYHLQGCNMRCKWCANPEGISIDGCTMVITDSQKGTTREKCSYQEYSVQELLQEVLRSRMMFFEGGGVTFTGGEPTVQFGELQEFLRLLKQHDIHTAMENNGTCRKLADLLPDIDYLIMDIKHPDSVVHQAFTGVPNEQILENIGKVLQSGRQIALRIPLIHGFNDTLEAQEGFCTFFREHPMEHATLEILPYHEYGKEKWQQCGMTYEMTEGFVTDQRVKEMEQAFAEVGVKVIHT